MEQLDTQTSKEKNEFEGNSEGQVAAWTYVHWEQE